MEEEHRRTRSAAQPRCMTHQAESGVGGAGKPQEGDGSQGSKTPRPPVPVEPVYYVISAYCHDRILFVFFALWIAFSISFGCAVSDHMSDDIAVHCHRRYVGFLLNRSPRSFPFHPFFCPFLRRFSNTRHEKPCKATARGLGTFPPGISHTYCVFSTATFITTPSPP